ncbi:hypothetical protein FK523_05330 [Curtobacterium flaccumfaciens pv. flaccumfaciens]|nr:hypothetical protein FK523_05330 [Curtobacterium flaccumfaciens pv. flaccumfaciens]
MRPGTRRPRWPGRPRPGRGPSGQRAARRAWPRRPEHSAARRWDRSCPQTRGRPRRCGRTTGAWGPAAGPAAPPGARRRGAAGSADG